MYALSPISLIACTNTIVSPYPTSDINIKAYPADGATLVFIMIPMELQFFCFTEQIISVVLNYYEEHNTYRHEDFDDFVYYGKNLRNYHET